jgi:hypothetical protein
MGFVFYSGKDEIQVTSACGLSFSKNRHRYRLAVGTASRYFLHAMRRPLDLKTVNSAHLKTFLGVAAILLSASMILLTGRYYPFWLWMEGIMLGFAINTMIGTWKPSEFRWASVVVIVGLITVMCVQGFKLWQQS